MLQEVEITVEARFPPTVRCPDLIVANRSVLDRNPVRMKPYEYAKAGIEHYWIVDLEADPDERFLAHVLGDGTYQRVGALVGDRVRTEKPVAADFTLDALTRP